MGINAIRTPIERDFSISFSDPAKIAGIGMSGGILRCVRRVDGAPFVLKFLPLNASSEQELRIWTACTPHSRIVDLVAVYLTEFLPEGHALLGEPLSTPLGSIAQRRPGRYYIAVMADMTGGDLFEVVAAGSVDECVVATVVAQCAAAVAHVHACGFVHGDVKLENFLLRRPLADRSNAASVDLVLCDFGFAREHAVQPRPLGARYTRAYIAPELIASIDEYRKTGAFLPVGPSCDAWCLGVAAYILLSRGMPFAPARGEPGWDDNATITPQLRSVVCAGQYAALPASRSGEAHAFVRELLCPLVALRSTAEQATHHPWLTAHAPEAAVAKPAAEGSVVKSTAEVTATVAVVNADVNADANDEAQQLPIVVYDVPL